MNHKNQKNTHKLSVIKKRSRTLPSGVVVTFTLSIESSSSQRMWVTSEIDTRVASVDEIQKSSMKQENITSVITI